MARIAFTIPDNDLADVLEALETSLAVAVREREKGRGRDYDSLPEAERLEVCIRELLRRRASGRRREKAAEKLIIPDIDI